MVSSWALKQADFGGLLWTSMIRASRQAGGKACKLKNHVELVSFLCFGLTPKWALWLLKMWEIFFKLVFFFVRATVQPPGSCWARAIKWR